MRTGAFRGNTPMERFAEGLYYGLQKLRGGVTREMVERASDLLDRPWDDVKAYVERRLERNYDLGDRSGLRWLREQRVTTKDDYRDVENGSPSLSERFFCERRRTSGSSGEPFSFWRDRRMTAWMDAAMWAVYRWHGVGPGDRMARFWGRPLAGLDSVTRPVADAILRQRRMNAFNVSPEASRAFYRSLLEWEPDFAYGYPTLIRDFVEHLRGFGDGQELDLEVVVTTGELLDDSTRRAVGEFFGCPVVDEYGCSESGILAFECSEGTSHLVPIAAYAEVMDEETGGRDTHRGTILITDLYGNVSPFVRYALGDVAVVHPPETCGCGRELPQVDVMAGRTGEFIRTPDDRRIYGAVLAYSVPAGVAKFRVRQTAIDELEGEIVVAPGNEETDVVDACRQRWQEAVGDALRVEVRSVDHIGRNSTGKFRYFVPLDAGDEDG